MTNVACKRVSSKFLTIGDTLVNIDNICEVVPASDGVIILYVGNSRTSHPGVNPGELQAELIRDVPTGSVYLNGRWQPVF